MAESAAPRIVLHIWPRISSTLSVDPQCSAALLYLQLTIPGRFSVAYSTDPDESPSGTLPFLSHGLHNTSGLHPIIKYVSKLPGAHNVDASLNALERAQWTARVAHVESEYGDLVSHALYAMNLNWWRVVRPALASALPVPQRYYVPGRLRDSYKPRLEAAELWGIPEVEQDAQDAGRFSFRREKKKKQSSAEKIKKTFEREKVVEKARAFLDNYAKLLGDAAFFSNHERPTTLDIVFAAHTHVLTSLELPDTLLQDLLRTSYPKLTAHASAVYESAFPDPSGFPPVVTVSLTTSLKSLVPCPRQHQRPKLELTSAELDAESAAEERKYRLIRWGWAGLAVASVVGYLYFTGLGAGFYQAYTAAAELEELEEEMLDEENEEEEQEGDGEGEEGEEVPGESEGEGEEEEGEGEDQGEVEVEGNDGDGDEDGDGDDE